MFCSTLLGISTLLFCFHELVDFKFCIGYYRANDLIVILFKFFVRFNVVGMYAIMYITSIFHIIIIIIYFSRSAYNGRRFVDANSYRGKKTLWYYYTASIIIKQSEHVRPSIQRLGTSSINTSTIILFIMFTWFRVIFRHIIMRRLRNAHTVYHSTWFECRGCDVIRSPSKVFVIGWRIGTCLYVHIRINGVYNTIEDQNTCRSFRVGNNIIL